MAGQRSLFGAPVVVLVVSVLLAAFLGPAIQRSITVLGVFRKPQQTVLPSSEHLKAIEGTAYCEDIHHHEYSNLLFTACDDVRISWFPPIANFDDPEAGAKSKGVIKTIDPVSLETQTLKLEGFDKPFVTHGIDILDDPTQPKGQAVFIFAVNHPPNPEHYGEGGNPEATKSQSEIEVFHHVIGSGTAQHIRTVWDPLITTPNDVLAVSPTSFFVTNDHYFREGGKRQLEDLYRAATWSNTIYVDFSEASGSAKVEKTTGVKASVALDNIHNNNGLAKGKTPNEVVVASCTSGVMHLADFSEGPERKLTIRDAILLDSTIDNPSYFADPYANATFDASAYLNCGLAQAHEIGHHTRNATAEIGTVVWKTTPAKGAEKEGESKEWSTGLLFEDDGSRVSSASTAVVVALQPTGDGARPARLFVTGPWSRSILAVNIDL